MKKLISHLDLRTLAIHLMVLFGFIVVSLGLFYPLLQGKKLLQSDTQQYLGMSRQLQESRAEEEKELYWVDNAYGGLPTYQLGAKYPMDVLTPIHKVFRLLPHPVYLVFLYFFSAYIFLCIFGLPRPYAILGALAYGLSTYLLIIIQVGHNTKAQAMGYFPLVLAAVHYLFRHRSLLGIAFAALVMGLQIRANHYQMTYYMLMLMGLYLGFQAWVYFRSSLHNTFRKKATSLLVAGVLALALNATSLLATAEYSSFSTRGQSELEFTAQGIPKVRTSGLSYDYITQFSYGIFESLNLIIPRIQGGASREDLGRKSPLYSELIQRGASPRQARQFVANTPTYWGDQPILEAPAYVGIVVVFLAAINLFLPLTLYTRWLFFGVLFSLLLSWGKNFDPLTQLFVQYFPLYNKFRAVSSIQVVLEFCFPVLAMLGLHGFINAKKKDARQILMKTTGSFLGLLLILYFMQWGLSFQSVNDAYYSQAFGNELMGKIVEARKAIYVKDLQRALLFILISTLFLGFFLRKRLQKNWLLLGVGMLLIVDLIQISNRYLNRELFIRPSQTSAPFLATPADRAILKDTTYFRVYEPALGLQGARTAYFHNTIGGYHGAKPRRLEELMDLFQLQRHQPILDILNVKYVLIEDEKDASQAIENPNNLGAAWFVTNLIPKATATTVYNAMTTVDFASHALIENASLEIPQEYATDSTATIQLQSNQPDKKEYSYSSLNDGFVVFSEMYYTPGWEAFIDNQPATIYRANYVLRGLAVPAGKHSIRFEFNPPVVKRGSWIQLAAIGVLLILIVLGVRQWIQINTKED